MAVVQGTHYVLLRDVKTGLFGKPVYVNTDMLIFKI